MLDLKELTTLTIILGDFSVLQTGDIILEEMQITILSSSAGGSLNELGQVTYSWNAYGPIDGPNGELQLDPGNYQCVYRRPVFSSCKNNCPGG